MNAQSFSFDRIGWILLTLFLAGGSLYAQVQVAGTLYVDLRATNSSAGSATWINQGTLANFTEIDAPSLDSNVAGSGTPGVLFDGVNDAYQGPNSPADIDGAADRSIEIWAYNPGLVAEETTVSWGHRGVDGRNLGFNFGNNGVWGAVTHYGGAFDVSWGATPPSAAAWRHLAYTYSNQVTRVYIDGVLANSRTHAAALSTFTNEPINLACQRNSSNGVRSFFYSGYLNTVRVHGGVLSASQISNNFSLGPLGAPTVPPPTPTGLAATAGYSVNYLQWNAASGATKYHLKRALANGGPYSIIASNLTATSHLDTGLLTGTNYFYVVFAENNFGASADSSPVSAQPAVPLQPVAAGTVHVDLRATHASAGSATWTNQGPLGDFASVGAPALSNSVVQSGIPGVFFNGSSDAYLGPNSVADLDAGSDRSIEVWAFNPSIVSEETTVSWAHRGTLRRNIAFNFGNNAMFGAATHWADDVSWGSAAPDAGAWQHLVYTYENNEVRVYVNGALRNSKTLGGPLNTFPTEPINLACQREANSNRSLWYGGFLNTVRIHGGALNPAQIEANYYFGAYAPPPQAANDSVTLNPGAKALVPVLANDSPNSVFTPNVILTSQPSSGTAQVKPGGKILYTHNGGPSTSDQFSYVVQNLLGATSQVATVSVTITNALRLANTTITMPNVPPPLGYQVVDAFTNNPFFEDALALSTPPGSTNLLFVAERRGIISYVDVTLANPVRQVLLDIQNQVMFDAGGEGEMGLLGFDFHPGFATNGYFFVAYTALGPRQDRLSRFTANPNTLTAVDTNTQQIFFSVVDEVFNHNGSDVHFGPDGYLYMSMGDEGDQYNGRQNAQRIDRDFYSGLLRIDVDRKPGNVEPNPHSAIPTNGSGQAFYKIPIDDPYVHTSLGGTWNGIYYGQTITNLGAVRGEFFATGLRHPWRFWIDPMTSEIWVGDVGQDRFEEINIVTNGGNYGWAYYEGTTLARTIYPGQVNLPTNPPPGLSFGLYTYSHTGQPGDPQLAGNAVIGGVVYRGSRLPEINGAYVFGDFPVGGASTIWTLRRTNSSVIVQRIASDQGVAAFGFDPSNGDILIAAYGQNKVKRLVRGDVSNSTFPQKLSDTGVFADLASLAPNPGIVSYDPTIAFWSDYAIKRRWFTIPDLTNTVTFATDSNWTLPSGMKWIKHFDLELDRGNPNSPKRRLETRILVKTDTGNHGVSYKWNDAQDEAFLVDDNGDTFFVTITNGTPTNQLWEIPSRGGCIACHSVVGGHALTFHTREMNNVANLNGIVGNQIDVLSQAGYFSGPVPSAHTLPVYAKACDTNASLEYRVRS